MTTTTDLALLRRAVLIDPGSADARLVFADEIEGSGGEQEQRWAEMIRAGCELAKCRPDCGVGKVCRGVDGWLPSIVTCAGLRGREAALIRDLTPWLRRGERCGSCGGRRIIRQAALRPFKFTIEPPRIEPSASLFDTVEVECPTCHGIGWLGSLAAKTGAEWLNDATFSRGFVSRVELTADQVQDTGFMRRLFSEWPVTEAGLIGKEPWERVASDEEGWPIDDVRSFDWIREAGPDTMSIPPAVFDRLATGNFREGHHILPWLGGGQDDLLVPWREFLTYDDAVAALSRAIVSLGREAAGLPQLEEV